MTSPLRNCQRPSLPGEQSIIDTILRLFFSRGPSAIRWFVMTMRIDSFNRMFRTWFCSHIRQEVLKRMFPSFADGNPSSAIPFKMGRMFVKTSIFHGDPRFVFRGPNSSMFRNRINMKTATGTMTARFQILSKGNRCLAAIAQAFPYYSYAMFIFFLDWLQHNQSRKPLAYRNHNMILPRMEYAIQ